MILPSFSTLVVILVSASQLVGALPVSETYESSQVSRRGLDEPIYEYAQLTRRGNSQSTPKKEARKEYKSIGKEIKKEAKDRMGSDYKSGPHVTCTNCQNDWEHTKAQKYAKQGWQNNNNAQQFTHANVEVSRHSDKTMFHTSYHNGDGWPRHTETHIKHH